MSSLFSRVHAALRRTLLALAVGSALIPAGALAASSADGIPGADETPRAVTLAAEAPAEETAPPPRASEGAGEPATRSRADQPRRASRTRAAVSPDTPAAESASAVAQGEEAPVEADEPPAEEAPAAVVFATVTGQPLALPDAVRGVGFHESADARAVALDPVGTPTDNLNAARITLPAPSGPTEYMVLGSRGRANGATSAVDISMDHGVAVTAAVTGTVENVGTYQLYGRTSDELVEIIPDGRPDLRVRLLHVEGVTVAPGDRVEAGVTVVAATARLLPFSSQIDRYAGRHPHVHIEVHPRDPEGEATAGHTTAPEG